MSTSSGRPRAVSISTGNILFGGAQFRGHGEAILAGKHDVEHHRIEIGRRSARFSQKQIQRPLAIAHDGDRVPFGLQVELQSLGQVGFVFDNQNMTHAISCNSCGR